MVPDSGRELMPDQTESFGDALVQLVNNGLNRFRPDWQNAVETCLQILSVALLFSLLQGIAGQSGKLVSAASATTILILIFQDTDTLIRLASDTISEICEYGKLLCPVMTAALAAQGAVTSSAALYAGTSMFAALLNSLISRYFVPMVYAFLGLAAANSALGEEYLKKLADGIKNLLGWLMKTLLISFTTYMSITGVITGTTDVAALKAAKVTISTAVPVVGSILSDASETVLVSIGLMKNAAGIYGIMAALSVFLGPFMKVGIHYLLLKLSAALCSIFAGKNTSGLINDLSTAFGLLMAMLATACLMVLISTVCFLKGAG
jgi:stage III sporulation protein AE